MRKTLLALFLLSLSIHLYAQKFEISVQGYTGLFHYSGNYPQSTSFILQGPSEKQNYTNQPTGNKNGVSYGGAIQAQHVGNTGIITGLQAGFEVLRSKIDINAVDLYGVDENLDPNFVYVNPMVAAKGQTYLQAGDININPYIGYRLKIKKVKIDLMPGIDAGFNINYHEYGQATDVNGNIYKTNFDRGHAPVDLRLRLGTAITYNRFGVIASYSHGLVNYSGHLLNDSPVDYETHSEVVRLGITYRLW